MWPAHHGAATSFPQLLPHFTPCAPYSMVAPANRRSGVFEVLRLRGTACVVIALVVATVVAGCVRAFERQPVPAGLVSQAAVPGLANARFWGDEVPKDIYS